MKNKLWRKGLVVGIVFFLGLTCVIPLGSGITIQSAMLNFNGVNTISNKEMKIINVPDDYPTIQKAINHANDEDEIHVSAGFYQENIVVNKMVTIKGDGVSGTIIDGKGLDHTIKIAGNGVKIFGFTIQNSAADKAGVYISSNHFNVIQMNKITGNGYGIILNDSDGNQILDNWIMGNGDMGLFLDSCHSNEITGNKISKNGNNGCMVNFTSTFNRIVGNIASENGFKALNKGQINKFAGNGLLMNAASRGNTVGGNDFSKNVIGVKSLGASDNNIFNTNDFKENLYQNANDTSDDIWSSEQKGNYWSDYTGTDSDGDGIGDTPHKIPGNGNSDDYPLITAVLPNSPLVAGPFNVTSGDTAVFHVNTTDPNYDKVYFEIYWDDGGGWERTADMVNATKGIDENHVWNIPKNNKKTFHVVARSFVMIGDLPLYSDDSYPHPVTVPKTKTTIEVNIPETISIQFHQLLKTGMGSLLANTIIVPRDYPTIQAAVDNAIPDTTILVWAGIYEENIVIQKPLTIIGNGSSDTTIKGIGTNSIVVTISDVENVSFSGFTITNGNLAGMWIQETNNCRIQKNQFIDNNHGLLLFYSQNNTVKENHFTDCGFIIYGDNLEDFQHSVENNSVNNLELLYLKNWNDKYLGGTEKEYGSIILVNCKNISVDAQTQISNGGVGIELAYCSDINVKYCNIMNNFYGCYMYSCDDNVVFHNNTISDNEYGCYISNSSTNFLNNTIQGCNIGIQMWGSSNNLITGNTVQNSSSSGIFLSYSSDNIINSNQITENKNGIEVYSSTGNYLSNNIINRSDYNGLFLKNAYMNHIIGNTIEKNAIRPPGDEGRNGIELKQSNGNEIIDNILIHNIFYGVLISDNSNDNLIYHNIFYFNGKMFDFKKQACDYCRNIWDNGYPDDYEDWKWKEGDPWCGNYWSDQPIGELGDRYHGPDQKLLGEDNISDKPYEIGCGDNVDQYPLNLEVMHYISRDETPPELTVIVPSPQHLYIKSYEYDWLFDDPVIIGNLKLKASAKESSDDKWPSNFVEVKFDLINLLTGKDYTSGWIKNPFHSTNYIYEWDLLGIKTFGYLLLTVSAQDAAGNINATEMFVWIFKSF